jgi:hypothetical protein
MVEVHINEPNNLVCLCKLKRTRHSVGFRGRGYVERVAGAEKPRID